MPPKTTEDWKVWFENCYLDGDQIQEGQMLSSNECFDAIIQAITTLRKESEEAVAEARRERIICAAVKASDGYVFRGQWHATALYAPAGLQGMPKYRNERPHGDDQGFVTSTGRYVTREEAWNIAEAAGQLNERPNKTPGTLYSEDLDYAVTPPDTK